MLSTQFFIASAALPALVNSVTYFCMLLPFLRLPPCCCANYCVLNSESVLKIVFSSRQNIFGVCKVKPHGSLVPVGSTHRCFTPDYQRRRLQRSFGNLSLRRTHLGASFVLRCFQHLSLPHLLPGSAIGMTTRTPVMRPRSSRTGAAPSGSPAPTADKGPGISTTF